MIGLLSYNEEKKHLFLHPEGLCLCLSLSPTFGKVKQGMNNSKGGAIICFPCRWLLCSPQLHWLQGIFPRWVNWVHLTILAGFGPFQFQPCWLPCNWAFVLFWVWLFFIYLFIFETESCCVAQCGLGLLVLWLYPPKCWDYRRAQPCLASLSFLLCKTEDNKVTYEHCWDKVKLSKNPLCE
jgi:hypothetical protein